MCGITGLFLRKQQASGMISKVAEANARLTLRGPDSGSIYTNERVGLGHRRLSIIDTSACATQPMKDISGRYVIAYNGEIFNYEELSAKYLGDTWERIGGRKSSSDTEVLLYLLIEHGTACLEWLSGFFAFAFYDTETQEMLLGRDRFGKKPLLYYLNDDFFAFASEMKALLTYDIPRKLNHETLHQYLQLGYVPQQQCMLEGIAKVQPGHFIKVSAQGITKNEAYYTLKTNPAGYHTYAYDDAAAKLVNLMSHSVHERMISDVPLGAFLSGGIDSSVIVALASRYTDKLKTFSVGYKDNVFFDETKYAKLVADKYKTDHTVFKLSNNDFLEHLHDVLDYIDEPFADPSAIPFYILSKETKKHVTVALSGDGGDEVFGGYNKHAAEWRARKKSLINSAVKAGHPFWKALPKSRNSKLGNMVRQLHRFSDGARLSARDRYWRWASIATDREVASLLTPGYQTKSAAAFKERILSGIATDDFNEVLLTDMNLVLTGDMLVKADMMSMAASLEVRAPFLDYKVVDFAFSLPVEYKINNTMKKRLVQDAFRPMLPEAIYNRPKQGFDIPMLDWFRTDLHTFIFGELLEPSFVKEQGIFRPEAIDDLRSQLLSNSPEDVVERLWALIVFQYWYRKYML